MPMRTKTFDSIAIQDEHGLTFISPTDIRFCNSKGSYTKVNLTDNKIITVSKNLKEIQLLLGDEFFVRIHHSFLINLKHVKKYINTDGCFVEMDNGEKLSVSRNKRPDFLKRFKRL